MKSLKEFLSRLRPQLPSCPEPLALQALGDSAREFCTRTEVVERYVGGVVLRPGQAQYPLPLAACLDVIRVRQVWVEGAPLRLTPGVIRPAQAMFDAGMSSGTPCVAYVVRRGTLTLNPTPGEQAAGGRVGLLLAVRPTLDAVEVPDELLLDWAEPVVQGAVARLAANPHLGFASVELAGMAQGRFLQGVSEARAERNRAHVAGLLRMRGPVFSQGR